MGLTTETGAICCESVGGCTAPDVKPMLLPPDHTGNAGSPEGAVLLVDDEPSLRRLLARSLREEGLRICEAGCGEDALRIVQKDRRVRLLVTDIMMPGMSGLELAQMVAALRPDLPVLFISGFAGNMVPGGATFLQKPFTVRKFVEEVHRILQPRPALGS